MGLGLQSLLLEVVERVWEVCCEAEVGVGVQGVAVELSLINTGEFKFFALLTYFFLQRSRRTDARSDSASDWAATQG